MKIVLKLSYTTMATPDLNAEEAVRAAVKYGYQGVDIRVSPKKGELRRDSSTRQIKSIARVFENEGIKPSGILCYNKYGGEDASSWAAMTDDIKRHLEIAAVLGSPSIRIFAGSPRKSNDPEGFLQRTAQTLSDVLQGEYTATDILIQNHKSHTTAVETVRLIRMADNPRLGLVFSPDHCIENEDMDKVFGLIREVTRQYYVADRKKTQTGYVDILPGKGEVPVSSAYEALGGKSFSGWVTFKWEKIWNEKLEGHNAALPYFTDFFNRLYDSI